MGFNSGFKGLTSHSAIEVQRRFRGTCSFNPHRIQLPRKWKQQVFVWLSVQCT